MSAGAHEVRSAQFSLLKDYLDRASEVERTVALRLREFAGDASEDAEVQGLFLAHAEETTLQQTKLVERLAEIGGPSGHGNRESGVVSILNLTPQLFQASKISEERLLQNIIAAYAAESGEAAMCEHLAQLAVAVGDSITESLARDIQRDSQVTAGKLWHFLPTRSKIAFNMLTVSELDPAVETKMADDRIES